MDFKKYTEAIQAIAIVATGKEPLLENTLYKFFPHGIDYASKVAAEADLDHFTSIQDGANDKGGFFSIGNRHYKIKKEDLQNEDPVVYSVEGDLISNSAYTFVLIELGICLSEIASAKYEHHRFDIYYSIRKNFDTLIKDSYYSNKLWLKKGNDGYVVTIADIKIILVGSSQSTIANIVELLGAN
ncbi:hypothetical protein [Niabella ginsengisoli]|uniref:Uncharacterized protein n=1 Tax=Niabella ginsengisoli TaxID=522298 RepID=A0ABS9SLN5_9BACT|nr:hypothetical protein [Niabella ginsengisoli]MCH5599230.1 hypothetical protein [Niabella ginsengisoli]